MFYCFSIKYNKMMKRGFLIKIKESMLFLIKRSFSSKSKPNQNISNIRNVGILAHIDAGKTTTTERMLYFSGLIRSMGEVHHGNTVTDFMEQERERGITITSASVTFPWKNHVFNLIDTPGHIDFTMEVEQTLNVLDGAVIVLDASAGVEAQTLTVWRQADKYRIPKVAYLNKTDRADADIDMCCKSIESKLDIPTLLVHLPIKTDGKLEGIIDLVSLNTLIWDPDKHGKIMKNIELDKNNSKYWELALRKRNFLIEKLSDLDDNLANKIIEIESIENIDATVLNESLKKITHQMKGVPVLCGSSYKNIGVQPLMDAVISYLPSPVTRNKEFKCFEDNLSARAFKVMHDQQRGPVIFFRVYSGHFLKGQKIYNVNQNVNEHTGRLMIAYADDFEEVSEVTNGNIAVVTGLKKTITGDLITSNVSSFISATQVISKKSGDINQVFNLQRIVPEPVFFCSIEPPSLAYQNPLENALAELQREDPSLRVTYNEETGQTVLAGMGELHLEIIKDRIKKKYKIDAELGDLQIAYRETPMTYAKTQHTIATKIGTSKQSVKIIMSIKPCAEKQTDWFKLDKSQESASNLANMYPKHLLAIKHGAEVAVNHGPKLGCPVVNATVMLHYFESGRGTSETIISAAVTQCIQKLYNEVGTKILEPIMLLEVVTYEEHLSTILADLSRRRASIENIDIRGQNKIIHSLAPLSELLGYATDLRSLTSGTGTFSMEFHVYQQMSAIDEANAIRNVTGF